MKMLMTLIVIFLMAFTFGTADVAYADHLYVHTNSAPVVVLNSSDDGRMGFLEHGAVIFASKLGGAPSLILVADGPPDSRCELMEICL